MLSRLPHELRLKIFHFAFAQSESGHVIRVEDTVQGIKYRFADKYDESGFGGAVSCLDAAMVGEGVAAAAAEALYQSKIVFSVDANILCSFLHNCPLSRAVEPGAYIKDLRLYMDEDPNFIGDGHGQALRKADWVDLGAADDGGRITRSGHRTQQMRRCWIAILSMPELTHFEFRIMPSQGKASKHDIQRFEIRDIIPMLFRLRWMGIDAKIHLRTWELYDETRGDPLDRFLSPWSQPDTDVDGFYESDVDLSSCVPHWRIEPTARERAEAANTSARRPGWTPSNGYGLFDDWNHRAICNYDALQEYLHRLLADKNYKYTIEGKTRRKRTRAKVDDVAEAECPKKRRC